MGFLVAQGAFGAGTTLPFETLQHRADELSRRAVTLIEHGKLSDAEHALRGALALMPDNWRCLYNLASVQAANGESDAALDDLERAADNGFTDFSHLKHNPAFASLRDLPRYRRLLAREDLIRHHAAEQILDELKSQFGADYLYAIDEPRRLIFAAHTSPDALVALQRELAVESASEWAEVFSHKPDEFIRVVVASPSDFAKLERRRNIGGRYDDSTRTLLVKTTGPELRHEFTHALHAADQRALDQQHPAWLSEGLATLYENARLEPSDDDLKERMIPDQKARLGRMRFEARRQNFIPLTGLVTMDSAMFTSRANLSYDEAGTLLLYLYEHQLLKKFYDVYTAGYRRDPTGRDALEKVTGLTLAQLQKQWVQWLLGRTTAPRAGGS